MSHSDIMKYDWSDLKKAICHSSMIGDNYILSPYFIRSCLVRRGSLGGLDAAVETLRGLRLVLLNRAFYFLH